MYKFDGTDDVFDSRDAISRIAELETEYAVWNEDEGWNDTDVDAMTDEERAEYDALKALEAENITEWSDGATLIHEDYFEEYTKEMLQDIGYITADLPDWIVIDWSETAGNVKVDYTEVEFRDSIYLVRS